jgi:hypothetical protein
MTPVYRPYMSSRRCSKVQLIFAMVLQSAHQYDDRHTHRIVVKGLNDRFYAKFSSASKECLHSPLRQKYCWDVRMHPLSPTAANIQSISLYVSVAFATMPFTLTAQVINFTQLVSYSLIYIASYLLNYISGFLVLFLHILTSFNYQKIELSFTL